MMKPTESIQVKGHQKYGQVNANQPAIAHTGTAVNSLRDAKVISAVMGPRDAMATCVPTYQDWLVTATGECLYCQ